MKTISLYRVVILFGIIIIASACRPTLNARLTRMTGDWYPYSTSCASSDSDTTMRIDLYLPMGDISEVAAVRYKGMISEEVSQVGSYLKASYSASKKDDVWVNLIHSSAPTTKTTQKDFPRKNEERVAVILQATFKNGKQRRSLYAFERVLEKECGFEHPLTKRN